MMWVTRGRGLIVFVTRPMLSVGERVFRTACTRHIVKCCGLVVPSARGLDFPPIRQTKATPDWWDGYRFVTYVPFVTDCLRSDAVVTYRRASKDSSLSDNPVFVGLQDMITNTPNRDQIVSRFELPKLFAIFDNCLSPTHTDTV